MTEDVMFSQREVPWMQLGTVITDPVDSAQAAKLGGLDFQVRLDPSGHRTPEGKWVENGRLDVVAEDTGETFDTVSKIYKPVQFTEAFNFLDQVNPRYVAAGTMHDRRQGFMVVQAPDLTHLDLKLRGQDDPHELFAVLRTSHDRSQSLEVAILTLRGKCMNQLTLPTFALDAPQRWSIRHVGDPQYKMHEASLVLRNMDRYADEYARVARNLAETDLLVDEVQMLLKDILPDRPKRDEQIAAITTNFTSSPRVGFPDTGWGFVQAVGEYFEWGRAATNRTPQSRFIGGLDGTTHRMTTAAARAVRLRRR